MKTIQSISLIVIVAASLGGPALAGEPPCRVDVYSNLSEYLCCRPPHTCKPLPCSPGVKFGCCPDDYCRKPCIDRCCPPLQYCPDDYCSKPPIACFPKAPCPPPCATR